jgi:hypothetical protein
MALADGGRQSSGGIRDGVGHSDADRFEALGSRQFLDQRAQPLRLQKSSFS